MKDLNLINKKNGDDLKSLLPTPFSIAILLTVITFLLSFIFQKTGENISLTDIFGFWEKGLWSEKSLVFAFQMMLMLVLGHALALTKPIKNLIGIIAKYCNNTANAAAIVSFLTILVSLFNWGLGLIFGAIFARKVAEYATEKNINLNYPLIGASGYSGLMVWHGGLSGSAPIKAAEECHIWNLLEDSKVTTIQIPDSVLLTETIFSNMNIVSSCLLIIFIPLSLYLLGKKTSGKKIEVKEKVIKSVKKNVTGAERIDYSQTLAYIISISVLLYCMYKAIDTSNGYSLSFINPNFINLFLFGLAILLHSNFSRFLRSIDSAISGASGILIQFPLYFGIMGVMKETGMIAMMSDFFIAISTENTFPIFTFISSGIVNFFVPSGGGQWIIQGPIILEAASGIGVSFGKTIMAMAYGDQLTNMLQPFWAIPLLSITGLKAKEIIPYTLYLLLIGSIIFLSVLIIF